MAVKVTKASAPKVSIPKTTIPKPKVPKTASMKTPSIKTSTGPYASASKIQNGLKGAITKNQLAQMNQSDLNQSF